MQRELEYVLRVGVRFNILPLVEAQSARVHPGAKA